MVDVNDRRLHAIDEGEGDPLVFLHGFPLSHAMWDSQRRAFRASRRVIIPDLRGFGRSVGQDEIVTMDDFADDLTGLLDALEITAPITLCGLSMGGYIALAFAHRYASRLGRLVLCDTRSLPDNEETAETRRKMADRVLVDGPRPVIEAMLPRLFGPGLNERQPAIVDAVRNVMQANSSRAIAAAQRGMAARPDATPWLKDITVPTLLIAGERDVITPPEEMRAMAAAIPNSTFVQLPGAGHMANMEDSEAFNTALGDWLAT